MMRIRANKKREGEGEGEERKKDRRERKCIPQILPEMTDRTRHLFILVCRERDQWLFRPSIRHLVSHMTP